MATYNKTAARRLRAIRGYNDYLAELLERNRNRPPESTSEVIVTETRKSDNLQPHKILSGTTHTDILPAVPATGDLITRNSASKWVRLPVGTEGQVLKSISGLPTWSAEGGGANHNLLSGTHPDTLPAVVVAGDLIISNSTPKWSRLPLGATTDILQVSGGLPTWVAKNTAISHEILSSAHSDVTIASAVTGDILYRNSLGSWQRRAIGTSGQVLTTIGGIPEWSTYENLNHTWAAAQTYSAELLFNNNRKIQFKDSVGTIRSEIHNTTIDHLKIRLTDNASTLRDAWLFTNNSADNSFLPSTDNIHSIGTSDFNIKELWVGTRINLLTNTARLKGKSVTRGDDAFTTTDFAASEWGIGHNNINERTWLCYNNAGVVVKVQLV